MKSFGTRPLDEVAVEINTKENVAIWCQILTRTGHLAVSLEADRCFDAEVYADEMGLEGAVEFHEDQRSITSPLFFAKTLVILGKWILRYLFAELIDAEITRDNEFRHNLVQESKQEAESRELKERANLHITVPEPVFNSQPDARTPRAAGVSKVPTTPGMSIGLATPATAYNPQSSPGDSILSSRGVTQNQLGAHKEEDESATDANEDARTPTRTTASDYFAQPQKSPETASSPKSPVPRSPSGGDDGNFAPASFMGRLKSFGSRKLTRTMSSELKAPFLHAGGDVKTAEGTPKTSSDDGRLLEGEEKQAREGTPPGDTFRSVIERIREEYVHAAKKTKANSINSLLKPSLPTNTPVQKPPRNTTIIVQEDRPDSGGIVDVYRGTLTSLAADVDILEDVAPAWLAELLLLDKVPLKDSAKISFILTPHDSSLPPLPNT